MDSLGNKTDEHKNCGGKLIRDLTHDAFYCTGCGEWVDDVCGDDGCSFCKDRPVKPVIEDKNEIKAEVYRVIRANMDKPKSSIIKLLKKHFNGVDFSLVTDALKDLSK